MRVQPTTKELIAMLYERLPELFDRAAPVQESVHQWRQKHSPYWYDGYPDNDDGGGPYETRTLYTTPPAAPVQEPVQPVALEGGKRLIVVDQSFDDLMYWLGRCEDKGHLENCPDLVEPWSAFQYENYATPPAAQRPWVGLTDEEILEAAGIDGADTWLFETAYAIESKLKEKNNG